MRTILVLTLISFLLPATALAQFAGPTTTGQASTAAQARNARVDSDVTLYLRVKSLESVH